MPAKIIPIIFTSLFVIVIFSGMNLFFFKRGANFLELEQNKSDCQKSVFFAAQKTVRN